MTISFSRKRTLLFLLIVLALLSTVVLGVCFLKDEIWSVTGQSAFSLAKTEWAKGNKAQAVEFWLYGIQRTIRDTIDRGQAYRILEQSNNLLEQGKLTEALDSCYTASRIYNEEGEVTYRCLRIEQMILGTPTPSQ